MEKIQGRIKGDVWRCPFSIEIKGEGERRDSKGRDKTMFSYILWFLIIIAVALMAKRVFSGMLLGVMYILIIIFAVFLLDTITPFPVRDYITLEWYDDTLEEPVETVKEKAEGAKELGKKAAEYVSEAGKNLDIMYGTGLDKEWKLKEEEEDEVDEKDVVDVGELKIDEWETDIKVDTEGNWSKDIRWVEETEYFIKYKDVKKELKGKLSGLSKDDKEIVKSMTSIYKTRIEGKDIEVWNTGEDGGEGFYLRYVE